MAPPTLSMTMIARDEEATIGRVLFQAKQFCDELIVVDTGSTDRTVSIAEAAGARVLHFPWVDDFSAARNHALEAATTDWVIWLDADDVVTREMQGAFSDLKSSALSEGLDGVYVQYRYHFDENGACTFAFPRERFVRRTEGARWSASCTRSSSSRVRTSCAARTSTSNTALRLPSMPARRAGTCGSWRRPSGAATAAGG
ncbi:MAG: glycosyltransferase family 2 protein, partial [Actinomycetota bacterium]|nr:glycosyltransferase family 2 protein [Actinomycetota bacterium]